MNDIGSHDRSTFPYPYFEKVLFQTKRAAIFHSPMKSKGCGVSPAALVFFMRVFCFNKHALLPGQRAARLLRPRRRFALHKQNV
jgi:hypothetical protein